MQLIDLASQQARLSEDAGLDWAKYRVGENRTELVYWPSSGCRSERVTRR